MGIYWTHGSHTGQYELEMHRSKESIILIWIKHTQLPNLVKINTFPCLNNDSLFIIAVVAVSSSEVHTRDQYSWTHTVDFS